MVMLFHKKQDLEKSLHTKFYSVFFKALLLKCFIVPFHNKAASRHKVCIENAIVFFLGFASQMVPYTFS